MDVSYRATEHKTPTESLSGKTLCHHVFMLMNEKLHTQKCILGAQVYQCY